MIIPLDRDAPLPLSRQIALHLEDLIRQGHLPGGVRLPTTRSLARTLDVNRKTVDAAYDELAARKLVAVRRGHTPTVRATIPESAELDLPFRAARARDPFPPSAWAPLDAVPEPLIDLAGVTRRVRHYPASGLRRLYEEALAQGGALFTAAPPLGEVALRRAGARLLAQFGFVRDAEDVAVFARRSDAIGRLLDLFVPAGGVVLFEAFPDPDIGTVLRERRVRSEVLPDGDDAVGEILRDAKDARLLIVQTGVRGAPGAAPGVTRRRALLDGARGRELPVVEDVSGLELVAIPGLPPLAALDASGRVLSLCDLSNEIGGDASAALLAGTPKMLERLRIAAAVSPAPDRLTQRVLAAALGDARRTRVQRALREKRRLLAPAVQRACRRRLAALPEAKLATGGDAVMIPLPPGVDSERVKALALTHRVAVCAARDCAVEDAEFLLVDLTRHEEGEILEGIRRLGHAVEEALGVIARSPAP